MAQAGPSNTPSLPGIITDQPEVFESEPALSDDTGVNDLDLNTEPTDEAIALIDVPVKQAFSYFAEREHEIAKFYVQRYGEYKIAGSKPDEESDEDTYWRLVSEVNKLLDKFQSDQASGRKKDGLSMPTAAMSSNLEVLSRQLKELEVAAEDGTLDPVKSGYLPLKKKLNDFEKRVSSSEGEVLVTGSSANDETARLIQMSALERRLNMLESYLGNNNDKLQNLLKTTKCENLTDAAETLGSWMSFLKEGTSLRVNNELDFLTQRLEKLNDRATTAEDLKQLDPQAKSRLDHLYNLVTSTDKHRALVPTIIHRLNAMEDLQQKAAQVSTTVNYLEQTQAQIVDSLQANKGELSSLTEMFAKNIDLIKEFSADIDSRIKAIRERDQ